MRCHTTQSEFRYPPCDNAPVCTDRTRHETRVVWVPSTKRGATRGPGVPGTKRRRVQRTVHARDRPLRGGSALPRRALPSSAAVRPLKLVPMLSRPGAPRSSSSSTMLASNFRDMFFSDRKRALERLCRSGFEQSRRSTPIGSFATSMLSGLRTPRRVTTNPNFARSWSFTPEPMS